MHPFYPPPPSHASWYQAPYASYDPNGGQYGPGPSYYPVRVGARPGAPTETEAEFNWSQLIVGAAVSAVVFIMVGRVLK